MKAHHHSRFFVLVFAAMTIVWSVAVHRAQADETIPIAEIKHEGPVDFEKEILPVFRRNCLACHNSTTAESGLVLETPEAIRTGGSEGPAVDTDNSGESLVLQLSARQRESFMPPDDNKVGAKRLTAEELGLIKLWIEQGATGTVSQTSNAIQWQPLPAGVNPIYAVAMTRDGQYAAAGRANQIFLYHVPSKRELGRLTDPSLLATGIYQQPGVADLDLIQSLTFSPDGVRLISGGFRTVKVWQRQRNVRVAELPAAAAAQRCVAVRADGQLVAVGDESGQIRLLSLPAGQQVAACTGHAGPITGLEFSPDGQQLYSSSLDRTLRVWRVDGAPVASAEAPSALHAVVLVDGGKTAVTAGDDTHIRLWDVSAAPTAGRTISGHAQAVTALARVNDNQFISGSLDGTVRHWQAADGQQLREMNHGGPVVAVASRSDGSRFASASADQQTTKIWNAADGSQVAELRGDFRRQLVEAEAGRTAALAKRLTELAAGDVTAANERKKSEEENLKKTDEERKKADEELAKKVEAAKQPVADKEAADKALETAKAEVAQAEQTKKAADEAVAKAAENVKTAEEAVKSASADDAKAKAEQALTEAQTQAQTASDSQKKAEQAFAEANTRLQQADEKAKQAAGPAQKAVDERTTAERTVESATRASERAAQAVQKAADAIPPLEQVVQQLTAAQQQAEARLTEAQQATAAAQLVFRALAFSSDGKTLATSSDDQTIRLWDVESGAPIDVLEGQGAVPRALAFTADDRLISLADSGPAVLWETRPTWSLERTLGSPDATEFFVDRVTALDVSPDGQVLATGTGEPSRSGEISLWNLATGERIRRIADAHSDEVFSLDFSRDGQLLVSSAADRFVKVFRVADGAFVRAFEGHTHHVLGAAWSADGRQLSSSGADKVVKVWNAITGDQLRTIAGFNKEVTSIRYVGDTDQVVASCGDASVQMKNASNGGDVRSLGGGTDFMYAIDVSADGNAIVAAGQDSVLRIWKQDGTAWATFAPPAAPGTEN